ncbi:MAG: hypothetical protein QOH10_178 [Actinomycetota bacterium]|nr:hypothetical protein [Actinomycetota bacterium]
MNLDLARSIGWRALLAHRRDAHLTQRLGNERVDGVYRRIWADAADEIGATVSEIGDSFLAIERPPARTVVYRHHVMLDDDVSLKLVLHKVTVHRMFAEAGLPIAEHLEIPYNKPRLAFGLLAGGPCVVKPASGTAGGLGVTCGVHNADALVRACVRASRSGKRVLVERQALGDEYRLLFLDGRLLDVIRRVPPRVEGDGHSTIGELILNENRLRRESVGQHGLPHIHVDLDCVLTLERQDLSLSSVPKVGQLVVVKSAANENGPADNETVTDVAPALVNAATRAATVSGLRLAGVELVKTDAGCVILEVNGTPGLHYHYQVADRDRAAQVAVPILEQLLSEAESSR